MATLIQYLPLDNTTLANFKLWAQAIGTAFSTFGWTKSGTPTATVNWSTIPYSPYTANPSGSVSFGAGQTLNHRGNWSNASVTYAIGDTVISSNATWACQTAYTTTASSPSPENEYTAGSTIHWALYPFEVWTSAGSPTMYVRVAYLGFATSVSGVYPEPRIPRIRVAVGTSVDSSGNLANGTTAAGNVIGEADLNRMVGSINAVVSPGTTLACFFSGDSTNRFSMLMWPDAATATLYGYSSFFCIERSLTNTGSYYTTFNAGTTPPQYPYWTAIWWGFDNQFSNEGSGFIQCQVQINNAPNQWVTTTDTTPWTAAISGWHQVTPDNLPEATSAGNGNQSMPAFPIWPIPGWVGNPMTAVMSLKAAESPGISTFTAFLYGTQHTFLACRNNSSFSGFGWASSQGSAVVPNAIAMRFD